MNNDNPVFYVLNPSEPDNPQYALGTRVQPPARNIMTELRRRTGAEERQRERAGRRHALAVRRQRQLAERQQAEARITLNNERVRHLRDILESHGDDFTPEAVVDEARLYYENNEDDFTDEGTERVRRMLLEFDQLHGDTYII